MPAQSLKTIAPRFLRSPPGRGIYQLLRLLLTGVFFWSGLSKALAPQDFATTIAAYGLLPENLITGAAVLLIALELIAAGGLLLEKRGALLLLTLQLLVFMAVLGYGIRLGLDIDCGCFGPNDPEAAAFHDLRGALLRDCGFLSAIAYLYAWRFQNRLRPVPWLRTGTGQAFSKEE